MSSDPSSAPVAKAEEGSSSSAASSAASAPAAAPKLSYAARAAAAAAAPASAAAPAPVITGSSSSSSSAPRTKKSIPKLPANASRKREMWALFEAATREILDKWDLLRTAVIEEWGGRSSKAKYEVIVSDLLMNVEEQWKAGHDLHVDTLDVYLLECLDADFNVDFEDDSVVTEASLLIQDVYRKCALGEEVAVRELLSTLHSHAIAKKTTVDRPGAAGDDDEDSDEDDEDDEGFDEEDEEDEGDDDEDTAAAGAGREEKKGGKKKEKATAVDEDGWATVPTTTGSKKGGKGSAGAGEGGTGTAAATAAATTGSGSGSAGAAFAALSMADDDDDEAPKLEQ